MVGVDDKSLTENSAGTNRTSLWGGRFAGGPAEALARLSVSVQFDWRLAPYDLAGSRAHARVLAAAGLLDPDELGRMLAALDDLEAAVRTGTFRPTVEDEDVHTALERGLLERLGTLGGKLRAGRSRNDQVATDLRLYLRDHARGLAARIVGLADALVEQAARNLETPAPGMTHVQHAQPVTFGHWLLAHVQPLLRDLARLRDWDHRAAVSPLGAGALAGSGLPLDPVAVSKELGFRTSFANSMDAVADRDFVAEFLFVTALLGVHLSRLGEEVVMWTSQEFGWVELDDSFATGSSIMPQKKNADVAELARGKSGRLIGGLVTVLTMLKGLPMAYDRDMQEDKEPAFDAIDTLDLVLPALAGMVSTMTVRVDRLAAAAPVGFSLATEVADWLVRKGVPFREAHEVTGRLVALCVARDCELDEVSDDDLRLVSEHLDPGVRDVLSVRSALAARTTPGSTGPGPVSDQLVAASDQLDGWRQWSTEQVIPNS
ncbi:MULTISPECIES: argininosuccinate lyase [unclassified Plantactinospora]|uniref:argininosuccinate lyase n=1 Tax=unclassified Plantactinospora TaxID=2631981 RepID=UPI000D17091E|nr:MULTISPECIES: argininosuccinate lyase [unclassified Plantactinospora]AVT34715.1 argininosuccinate lyase [Plantactinospora sp. BC1]AVT41970.1 argininosuccinate lyase [Plantactinospora sp. BB1]